MQYTFDSRAVRPGMGFVALKGEKVDGHDFIPRALAAGAAKIIDGLEELQRAACEYRRGLSAKVIGVTGSAGKTTTKEFLKALLASPGTEGNFNNHIGLPMTILNCPQDAQYLVVEMGTNHPGEIAALCDIAEPDIGVIASIGTAHIEFFGSRTGIAAEKGTLFARAREFNVAGEDCNELATLRKLSKARLVLASAAISPKLAASCPLPGAHNVSNLMIAYAVAQELGISEAECLERLADFHLPGARWRKVERGGVTYIDDTYNANPDSMIAALEAFAAQPGSGRKIAVLGDMFELGDKSEELHRRVFEHAAGLGLATVVGVGAVSSRCRCDRAYSDLATFVRELPSLVRQDDLVLLKASHGMRLGSFLADENECPLHGR